MGNTQNLLPGTLLLLILRTLAPGPLHGYAICRRIRQCSSGRFEVDEGSLYPALQRMLVKGWITAAWGVSETNRKARFYTLTRLGKKQLAAQEKGFLATVSAIRQVLDTA